MDLDFDFEDDKIKTFLLNKLEEVKAHNDELKVTLHKRQMYLKSIIDSSDMKMDDTNVKITSEVWKKIYNNKYALGVTIENSGSRCLHSIKTLLKWNSSYPLQYQATIFEESNDLNEINIPTEFLCDKENCNCLTNSLRKSNKVDRLAHVVIVLEVPKFIDKLSYNIVGNIIFQQYDGEIVLMFPPVEISAHDVSRNHVSDSSLPSGGVQDILTLISCTERTDLVMVFPVDWSSSVDSTFEILCSLTKVNMSSSCKQSFIAHRLSPAFDGSLLEFHASSETSKKVHYISVYSRNEDCLLSLLHHLHQNIAGVVIIPKMFYMNYIMQNLDHISGVEESLEKFNECINREINFVSNFRQDFSKNVDDEVVKFRTDLADLEMHTDLLYIRVCQLNDQSNYLIGFYFFSRSSFLKLTGVDVKYEKKSTVKHG